MTLPLNIFSSNMFTTATDNTVALAADNDLTYLLGVDSIGANLLNYISVDGTICTEKKLNSEVIALTEADAKNILQLNNVSTILSNSLTSLSLKIDNAKALSATNYRFGTIKLFSGTDSLPTNYYAVRLSTGGLAYVYAESGSGGGGGSFDPDDYAMLKSSVNDLLNLQYCYYVNDTDIVEKNKNTLFSNIKQVSSTIEKQINYLARFEYDSYGNISSLSSGYIYSICFTLSAKIQKLSTALSNNIDALSANLSSEIQKLSTALSSNIDALSAKLSAGLNYDAIAFTFTYSDSTTKKYSFVCKDVTSL